MTWSPYTFGNVPACIPHTAVERGQQHKGSYLQELTERY